MEHDLKLKQLEMGRPNDGDSEEAVEGEAGEDGGRPARGHTPKWDETLAGQTKLFGNTLSHA